MSKTRHFDPADAGLVKSEGIDWVDNGTGNLFKILRVSKETGHINMLIKSPAGQVNPPHTHLGPADFYVIKGTLEYRGGCAKAGDWIYEPTGAVHDATSHPEETIYLANVYGPIAFHDDNDGYAYIFDWRDATDMLERQEST